MSHFRSAVLVGTATLAAAVQRPTAYRAGWALLLLVCCGGLVGAGLWAVLLALATVLVEWPCFARADRTFSYGERSARAVARVRVVQVEAGVVWKVSSVAAWPLGSGAGTALMAGIVETADREGAVLELQPATRAAREWYLRLGFVATGHKGLLRRTSRSGCLGESGNPARQA